MYFFFLSQTELRGEASKFILINTMQHVGLQGKISSEHIMKYGIGRELPKIRKEIMEYMNQEGKLERELIASISS